MRSALLPGGKHSQKRKLILCWEAAGSHRHPAQHSAQLLLVTAALHEPNVWLVPHALRSAPERLLVLFSRWWLCVGGSVAVVGMSWLHADLRSPTGLCRISYNLIHACSLVHRPTWLLYHSIHKHSEPLLESIMLRMLHDNPKHYFYAHQNLSFLRLENILHQI